MKNPNERLAFSVSVRRGEQRWAGHASAIAILTKAATPTLVDCRKVSRRGKWQFFRARFYRSTKIRFSLILPLRESCWGVPSPNPAYAAYAAYPAAAMRQSKGGFTMRKRYNTPHRSRVVKTRMTCLLYTSRQPISSVSISARPQKRRWRTKSSVCSVRKSAKCDFFLNLMKMCIRDSP